MALTVGVGTSILPFAAASLAVLPIAGIALRRPNGRLLAVTLGGTLALGSPTLTSPKLAYLCLAAVSVLWACASLAKHRARSLLRALTPAVLFAAIAGVSTAFGLASGNGLLTAIRDAAPYALLFAVPIVALDGARTADENFVRRALVAVGFLGTLGFTLEWVARRGIAELPIQQFLIDSRMLGAALWCFSIASIATNRGSRIVWTAIASFSFALPLLTATRSVLLFLVAPLGMVLYLLSIKHVRLGATTVVVAVVPALLGGAAFLALSASGSVSHEVVQRFETLAASEVTNDASLRERGRQHTSALNDASAAPVIGHGFGHEIVWERIFTGETVSSSTVDSPFAVVAKVGLAGTFTLLVAVFGWRRYAFPGVWSIALAGFVIVMLAHVPLYTVIEDKGLSIALALLFTGSLSSQETSRPASDGIDVS